MMGIPLDVAAELFAVLGRHGVKYVGFDEMNGVITALTPCFQEGYMGGTNGWPLQPDDDEFPAEVV